MKLSITELTTDETGFYDELMRKTGFDIKVAIPAEITEVDFEKQTVKAQPVIRERLLLRQEDKEYKCEWVELPELIEVPFFMPFGGDYTITFPIKEGDECLIVFSDLCIDWYCSIISDRNHRHITSQSNKIKVASSEGDKIQCRLHEYE